MSETQPAWLERLVARIVRYHWLLFPLALILTLAAWPISERLTFDQSIESLYADDDPHLNDYLFSKSLFGGDEFAIVAYRDEDLFAPGTNDLTPGAEERIRTFVEQLNKIPGVLPESTQDLRQALKFPYKRDQVREQMVGMLLGSDQQTTAIVLRLVSERQAQERGIKRAETIAQIRALAAAHQPRAYVVGEPVQIHDMYRYVEQDGRLLFRVSLVLLGIVIFIFFRSLRWMLLPLIVVVSTIVWTNALLVLSGIRLSMVSSMLNSLVTVIAVAIVTHMTVHYRERRQAMGRTEALHKTFVDILPAVFWDCATTAGGFAALLSSQISPVQSFGTMMTLGTILVLASLVMIVPGGILIGRQMAIPAEAPAEHRLLRYLSAVTDSVERRPLLVGGIMIALVAFAAIGFLFLRVETDFSRNFRRSSDIVQSLDFFEENLGGAGTWEVNFPAPKELTEEFLDRVRALAERLRKVAAADGTSLTKAVAITDGLDLVPTVPFVLNTLDKRLAMLDRLQSEFRSSLYNAEEGRMRIVLRAKERQPADSKLELISLVEQVANEEFPGAQTTGLFVLLANIIVSLMRDQWVNFAIASIGIACIMSLAFRSIRIGLISIIPNAMPIVVIIGTMGWLGIPINIATAMIASVAMGLTVDSSIHYLAGYERVRKDGLPFYKALHNTQQEVGIALVFANIALVVGFSVLTLSQFIPLVYFGVLVSAAMLGGLIGNLVMLPLLLRLSTHKSHREAEASASQPQPQPAAK